MENQKIDFSRYVAGRAENEDVARQQQPQVQRASYFQRAQERDRGDTSSWSGASMAGGTWAGRSR